MTQQPTFERHERVKCPRIPDCPGHCTLCLKPIDDCKGHDPSRYERFSMSREPRPCLDQPRAAAKLAADDGANYNVL